MIRASAVDGVRGEHNSFNNGIYSASLGSRQMGKDGMGGGWGGVGSTAAAPSTILYSVLQVKSRRSGSDAFHVSTAFDEVEDSGCCI